MLRVKIKTYLGLFTLFIRIKVRQLFLLINLNEVYLNGEVVHSWELSNFRTVVFSRNFYGEGTSIVRSD